MNKLFFVAILAIFLGGCAAPETTAEAFHPTDSDALSTQGGKGEVGDGSEVNLTQDNSSADLTAPVDVKPFHPTDALLIGGNGPFNAAPDAEDEVNLDQNDNY
jgi:hypothetical protein